jgi:hypothetical protein
MEPIVYNQLIISKVRTGWERTGLEKQLENSDTLQIFVTSKMNCKNPSVKFC